MQDLNIIKSNYKLSIVTPSLNSEKFLEETILSIIEQKYCNLEYIIIDGNSSDNSLNIIKKYEKYLTYWVSEPDDGMYSAIQKGFEKSTGEIMTWINSDDKYHPGAFIIVNQIFNTFPDVDWIIGMPSFFNKDGNCVRVIDQRKWARSRFLLGDYKWIQQESVFWRRSLWEKAGGYLDTSLKYASDFELWSRFFQIAELYCVNTPLAGFRIHGKQISLIHGDLYVQEALKVKSKLRAKSSPSFLILKLLWFVKKIFDLRKSKMIVYLSLKMTSLMDEIHRFPKVIYFDFIENMWRK